jgi:hypothetical protein
LGNIEKVHREGLDHKSATPLMPQSPSDRVA